MHRIPIRYLCNSHFCGLVMLVDLHHCAKVRADPHQQTKWQLSVAKSKDKFCRDNFCLVRCIRIDMVIKPSNCVVGWQVACLKNCSILKASPCNMWIAKLVIVRGDVPACYRIRFFIYNVKGSLPLGLNSMNHQDSFSPLRKL